MTFMEIVNHMIASIALFHLVREVTKEEHKDERNRNSAEN